MSKLGKRVVSLVIALVMMMTACGIGAAAASAKTEPVYQTYASFGDSIASGFSYTDYVAGQSEWNEVPYSYPSLVRKDLGISAENYHQLAHIAFRTSEVRLVLDDNYETDAVDELIHSLSPDVTVENLRSKRAYYNESIQNADLITVGLGSNDLMLPLILALYQIALGKTKPVISEETVEQFKQKLEELGSMDEMTEYIFTKLEKVNVTAGQIKALTDALYDGYKKFTANYNYIIKYIYKLNPDAKVVIVGLYNPLKDMAVSKDIPVKIGKVADLFLGKYNRYLHYYNPYAYKTTFVDVKDTEVIYSFNADDLSTDTAFLVKVLYGIHPSRNGHAYIAKQIEDVL